MEDIKVLYPDGKIVKVGDKEVKIEKLPFKKFMQVAGILTSLNLEGENGFISGAEKIIHIITLSANIEAQYLEDNLDPKDAFILLEAIREVNNFPLVFKQGQEALRPQEPAPAN